jgi:hypothetical protein
MKYRHSALAGPFARLVEFIDAATANTHQFSQFLRDAMLIAIFTHLFAKSAAAL